MRKLTLALVSGLLAAAPLPALAHGPGAHGRGPFHRAYVGRPAPYFGGTAGRGFDPGWPGLTGRSDLGLAGRSDPLDWLHGRPDWPGRSPAPSHILLVPRVIDREAADRAERQREDALERQIDSALGDAPPSKDAAPGDAAPSEGDGAAAR